MAPAGPVIALASIFAALRAPSELHRRFAIAAAVASALIVPWTVVAMLPTNVRRFPRHCLTAQHELEAIDDKKDAAEASGAPRADALV